MNELVKMIQGFISQKREWTFWDFKQEWHKNNVDLLHDILCLANAQHSGNRYLIIGVTDPEDCSIVDVSNDPNRKRQADLIDFLSKQPFSGDSRPSIRLHSISLKDGYITDIIEIENESNKPFTLSEKVENQSKKLYAGSVYIRVGDKNTAKDSTADFAHVERMWRERFGLDLNPMQRMQLYLPDIDSWQWDGIDSAYHKQYPEFTIQEGESKDRIISNWWSDWPKQEPLQEYDLQLKYHQTVLKSLPMIHCDRELITFPSPSVKFISFDGTSIFKDGHNTYGLYHYVKHTLEYAALRHRFKVEPVKLQSQSKAPLGFLPFIQFESESQKEAFVEHLQLNMGQFFELHSGWPRRELGKQLLEEEKAFAYWAWDEYARFNSLCHAPTY